ncbi:spore coat protein [Proteiniborus sp.]|uniref:spore coat protein n=1 Tax=Proteiniborus sp. TaxID=2079015 RepID=UPI003330908A
MQERDIVNDVLSMTKASMQSYGVAIAECSNQQLRSALQKLRDEAEQFQYQLYQIAEQKGYYTPAPTASQQDVSQIKNQLNQP